MDSYGFLWIPPFLWIPYGFLWIPKDSYGFLWIRMDSLQERGRGLGESAIPVRNVAGA